MSKLDNPTAIGDKWASAMSMAGPAYQAGVNGVTIAPNAKAAAASAKYLAGVQANITKYEQNNLKVDVNTWKTATLAKADRLTTGAAAAKGKFTAFFTAFASHLKNGQAQIDAMPTITYEQRKAKAIAQMDWNHQFAGY